jgi:hypothetical protein
MKWRKLIKLTNKPGNDHKILFNIKLYLHPVVADLTRHDVYSRFSKWQERDPMLMIGLQD